MKINVMEMLGNWLGYSDYTNFMSYKVKLFHCSYVSALD